MHGLFEGKAILDVLLIAHGELTVFERHPGFPHVIARPVQWVFRVAVGCLQPYALGGEGFHATDTQVFLALAFLALILWYQPAKWTVYAPVILNGRKLCRYEISLGHIGLFANNLLIVS